jgi:phosphatidate cytidylyltransferase
VNNFTARTITGLSLAFGVLLSLVLDRWVFAGVFLLVVILGLNEFFGMVTSDTIRPQKIYGIAAGTLWYICYALVAMRPDMMLDAMHSGIGFMMLLLPVILLFLVPVLEIFRNKPSPLMNVSLTWFGMLYIPFALSCLIVLVNQLSVEYHGVPALLLGYFLIVWVYDTGAYLFGSRFGKHKFFERISPKKTWEGIIAGVVASSLLTLGLAYLIQDIPLSDWFILMGIVIVFGTFGDLFESLIKRNLNLKDSGSILPGHGGILDRFDTVFISAPFVFIFYIIRLYYL